MSETRDIPDDVMKAARLTRDGYNADENWFLADTAVQHIARAIMAERERCAEVARLRGYMSRPDRAEIVDSILSGEQP